MVHFAGDVFGFDRRDVDRYAVGDDAFVVESDFVDCGETVCGFFPRFAFGSGAADNKEDSQAFDADVCTDLNYVQYNYTHDNPSGSFFECSLGTGFETYYRYNISV